MVKKYISCDTVFSLQTPTIEAMCKNDDYLRQEQVFFYLETVKEYQSKHIDAEINISDSAENILDELKDQITDTVVDDMESSKNDFFFDIVNIPYLKDFFDLFSFPSEAKENKDNSTTVWKKAMETVSSWFGIAIQAFDYNDNTVSTNVSESIIITYVEPIYNIIIASP